METMGCQVGYVRELMLITNQQFNPVPEKSIWTYTTKSPARNWKYLRLLQSEGIILFSPFV